MRDGTRDDYKSCRENWADGRCPCCGSELTSWPGPDQDWEPAGVAEGVTFCGRCIGCRHHEEPPEFLNLLLKALAGGS